MVAVGMWGAQLGAPAIWVLPITFPLVMALGGLMGLMGIPLPGDEIGIALSALVLGVMVLAEKRPPLWVAAVILGIFAIFHGYAHGRELPPGESGMLYRPQRRHTRSNKMAAAGVLPYLGCPRAEAHLVTTGLGPVCDGIAHLVLSPADLAVVVVLTLLAAMRGPRQGRWLLVLLPAAWLAGGLTGLMIPIDINAGWMAGGSFLLAGALVAADRNLPLPLIAALAAVIGAFHGFLTGAAFAGFPSAALEVMGTLVALFVLVTLLAGLVVSINAFWARVAVRVLGSWIAATGLLMIGWTLRAGN